MPCSSDLRNGRGRVKVAQGRVGTNLPRWPTRLVLYCAEQTYAKRLRGRLPRLHTE